MGGMGEWDDQGGANGGNPALAWLALRSGPVAVDREDDGVHEVRVVEGGSLSVYSGRLLAVDPFTSLWRAEAWHAIPPGRYPVRVTWDLTLDRAMYVSLILRGSPDVRREPLVPNDADGQPYPDRGEDDSYGVGVDAGVVCFVDADALRRSMPRDPVDWRAIIEGDDPPGLSWTELLDAETPLPPGMANIPLPGARDGASAFLCASGWGNGYYPVLGGYDAANRLVAIHIDLLLLTSLAGD